jgi:hypothetical protein
MISTLTKKHSNGHSPSHSKAEKPKAAERRGTERHVFTATAEVVELQSGARFSTRTMDLGPGGCFVDTTVPFPVGSKLRINLQKGKSSFKTGGIVVYSQSGLGMGIAFDAQDTEQRVSLDAWLTDVTGDRPFLHDASQESAHEISHPVSHAAAHAANGSGKHRSPEWVALVRLVRVMISRGILTEGEGTSILHDPTL